MFKDEWVWRFLGINHRKKDTSYLNLSTDPWLIDDGRSLYFKALSLPFGDRKTFNILKKSAELGYPPAQAAFGVFHTDEPELAMYWFKQAMDQNDPNGYFQMYLLTEDPKWLKSAAKYGWIDAMAMYGHHFSECNLYDTFYYSITANSYDKYSNHWIVLALKELLTDEDVFFMGKTIYNARSNLKVVQKTLNNAKQTFIELSNLARQSILYFIQCCKFRTNNVISKDIYTLIAKHIWKDYA